MRKFPQGHQPWDFSISTLQSFFTVPGFLHVRRGQNQIARNRVEPFYGSAVQGNGKLMKIPGERKIELEGIEA